MQNSEKQSTKLKPLLKWAGGKFSQPAIYNRINQLYTPYRESHIWVENFCGGLGLTHQINPQKALLSDINPYLILFFNEIAKGTNWDRYQWMVNTSYDELREYFNDLLSNYRVKGVLNLDLPQFSALFYQINRRCFNGLWRVNSEGKFNTPEGKNSKGISHVAGFPDLTGYTKKFVEWYFQCQPYHLGCYPSNSYFVMDPPYDAGFTSYSQETFDWYCQIKLAGWVRDQKCPVILLNRATDRIVKLYRELGLTVELVETRRSISANGDRKPVVEVLAYKNIEA